jgi:hypothetical protein
MSSLLRGFEGAWLYSASTVVTEKAGRFDDESR